MAEQVITAPTVAPSTVTQPETSANVSAEDYMEHYAAHFYEWVEGALVKMSPVSLDHDEIMYYLRQLLRIFFDFRPIGRIVGAPFVMSIPAIRVKREPDLQIILNDNPGKLMKTYMDGPADICIEVVSPESVERDHGVKFAEYEKGKVREYWIIDPIHQEGRFYRLNDDGLYVPHYVDEQSNYQTPLLPQFVLHVPTLWQTSLPAPRAVMDVVRGMVSEASQE